MQSLHLRKGISIAFIGFLAFPLLAAAQVSYTSNPYYPPGQTGSCITLTAYQYLGVSDAYTGGQTTILQQFLNRTGYLNGISGYFDSGTYGAVVNYQLAHGITPTGTVGPITRASINQQSCNGSYPYPYPNPSPYPYNAPPTISSLSSTSGSPGMPVTIYGSNFSNNAVVYFNGSTASMSYSTNGTLTFTVPYVSAGTYQVYVSNAFGSSNSMTFSVNGNGNCGYYNNSYQCGCGYYPYNTCNNPPVSGTWFGTGSQPRISSISGQGSAPAGTTQTWSVMAYSLTNLPFTVTVDWGDGTSQQSSQSYANNPQQSYQFSHAYSSSGTYTIRFTATDTNGAYAYSTLPVSVYGYSNNNNNYGTPYLSSLSTNSASRGSSITLYGSNFSSNITVNLYGPYGNTYTNTYSYNNGSQANFTIPYITPGTYSISVMNASGQGSNTMSLTIY